MVNSKINQKKTDDVSFSDFVLSLGANALVAMGETLPGTSMPVDTEVNLDSARSLISTIEMLQERTRGNLSASEEKMMKNLIYTLRVKYVELSGKLQ